MPSISIIFTVGFGLLCFCPTANAFQGVPHLSRLSSIYNKHPENLIKRSSTKSSGISPSNRAELVAIQPDDVEFVPTTIHAALAERMNIQDMFTVTVPALTPILGLLLYEDVARTFAFLVEFLSNNNWVPVDGGAYQARAIAPALNGIVVPALSLLFATLTSTTIGNLRNRQVSVRCAINIEAGELRQIEELLMVLPAGDVRDRLRKYLIDYTNRLIEECTPEASENAATVGTLVPRGTDSELYAFVNLLNEQEGNGFVSNNVLGQMIGCIARLREQRQSRITALQSTFPATHYSIMVVSAVAQCTAFLMETNTSTLAYLSSLQLKVLWCILTTTFMTCFAVFADLGAPFSGSYQILDTVNQLYCIQSTLQSSAQADQGVP